MLRDYGESAVDAAAAVLQNALSELLRVAPETRVLSKETTHSPRKLALEAVAAFETAGGTYQIVLHKLTPEQRAAFGEALKDRGERLLRLKEPTA